MQDYVGCEITVGDSVAYAGRHGSGFITREVVKITTKRITVVAATGAEYRYVRPENCIVIAKGVKVCKM